MPRRSRPCARFLAALSLAWLVAAGAPARADAPPSAPTPAHPALWVVSDGDTTLYLFGTVHLLRPDVDWFRGRVREAFDAADEVMLEALLPDDPATLSPRVIELGTESDGPPLTEKLSPAQRREYLHGLDALKLAQAPLESFRPWFLGVHLAAALAGAIGAEPTHGADHVLQAEAQARSKPITTFETADEQLELLASLPESEQLSALVETVRAPGESVARFQALIASWCAGDTRRTARLIAEELSATPVSAERLLGERNRRWAHTLRERMDRPGTVFVAIGAGHLTGRGSVLDELRRLGFRARRLPT